MRCRRDWLESSHGLSYSYSVLALATFQTKSDAAFQYFAMFWLMWNAQYQ